MTKPFIERLMDLITIEANNGDYYVDGYVDASKLEELINEFYPEYEFNSYDTYCQWYPRNPNAKSVLLLQNIYNKQIIEQLETESKLLDFFKKPTPPSVGDRIKFEIHGTKTGRFTKDDPFKKDEKS